MSSAFGLGEIYILIGLFIIFFNFQSKFTALILGARYGKTEVCELLLSKGANVNSQTKVNKLLGYFVLLLLVVTEVLFILAGSTCTM